MATVYLSLGSNLGDRLGAIKNAIAALPPHVVVQDISSVYEAAPMYRENQPSFYNLAIRGATNLTPHDVWRHVRGIEQKLGRQERERNAPREIDIDLLLYDNLILNTTELQIPHPRMHERAFVVVPLAEIDPLVVHPHLELPAIELADALQGGRGVLIVAEEQV